LEAEGLATIAGVEGDLRRRAVRLTAEGADRLATALPAWRRAHDELAVRLDPDLAPRLARATATLDEE
jgi:DNA-binding MarR family transcriptional regulator